jgi:hypothetical protein
LIGPLPKIPPIRDLQELHLKNPKSIKPCAGGRLNGRLVKMRLVTVNTAKKVNVIPINPKEYLKTKEDFEIGFDFVWIEKIESNTPIPFKPSQRETKDIMALPNTMDRSTSVFFEMPEESRKTHKTPKIKTRGPNIRE